MNKYLKYGLWAIGIIVVVFASVIVYIALTFNPNDYKPQVIKAVKDSKQRTLKLDGDIKLHFFPSIGVSLGKISLSEFQSKKEFASVESASISLKLMPLLAKQIVVDDVSVSGVKAQFVKYKDGKTNLDDLLDKEAVPAQAPAPAQETGVPMQFDIASVRLKQAELSYHDKSAGARYSIKDLSLETGRIANALPIRIDFAAHIQSSKPELDITAQIKTTLTFDLEKDMYQVQGLALQANGKALDIIDLAVKAEGDASVQPTAQAFALNRFALAASGMKGKDRFDARLDAPELNLTKANFVGSHIALNAKLDGAIGKITAKLALPAIEGNERAFKVDLISLDADVKQTEQAFKLKLTSPLTGSIEAQQFNLSGIKLALNAKGDKLPGKNIDSELKGSVQADLGRQNVEGNLKGGLLQSQIKAKFAVKNFNVPMIRYAVSIDKFDADPYLPEKTTGAKTSPRKTEPEQPFDLSPLKTLNLDGSLKVGSLKAANVKVSQLRVDVKARDGIIKIEPLSTRLYQGSASGKVTVNANTSSFTVSEKLTGIDIAPLLKDAAELDVVEGKGNVVLDLTTQGNTVSSLKKALNGKASVQLADGAIIGINLSKLVQGIQRLSKDTRVETLGVNKDEKTEFSEFKASFKIRKGVAHNDDLAVRSTVLRIGGKGDIDIGRDRMDYNAKAILAKTEQGRTGTLPVHVSGPFDNLKIKVDYAALLRDVAKQKLDEKKEELKEKAKEKAKAKLEDELKKGLRGLFK